MGIVDVETRDEEARTAHALDWLADAAPELSARTLLSRGHRLTGVVAVVAVVVGLFLWPTATGIFLVGLITLLYVVSVVYRIFITNRSLRDPSLVRVSDDDARAIAEADLPIYTVLVPMFHEGAVVPDLIGHLRALEYPAEKLDVKLLVEAGDLETIAAANARAETWMQIVVVPESTPRTKPKALNYGLTLATGEYVTIYDAEDRPDVLQLRRAVVAFGRLPDDVGCLQAQLAYWNTDQNLLTRWFSIEYLQWFELLLPGLAAFDAPVPLGGTSNHIRRDLIEQIGAWDPYNVTEDADLGIRLHRAGFRSAVLASTTLEEANSDYVNWNNQRSRWYKGYIQTWLVHMRHPAHLVDELGWRGFAQFNAFVGGTPALALLNLVFWAMTLAWFVGHFAFIKALYPAAVYYPALFCFVFGNVIVWYQYLLAARLARKPSLVWAALGVPVYWLMMSIAAVKACWQVITDRSFWEKTVHGLDPNRAAAEGLPVAEVEEVVRVAAPAFVTPAAPALATRVGDTSRRRIAWTGRISHALQLSGYALMGFVVYVIALSGFGPAFASPRATAGPLARVPSGGATIARLAIPSVGINTTIAEGTGSRTLRHGVGHVRGSALPGEHGESVVVGHRYAEGAEFHALASVRVDDTVAVTTADGSAQYRVTAITAQKRGDIVPSPSGPSRLLLVTGTSGWNPARLLVVRTAPVGKSTIRFAGAPAPYSGIPRVPGFDGGKALTALVLAACAVFVLRSRRRIPVRVDPRWATVIVAAASAAVLYAAFVAATQALPPSF